MSNIKPSYIKIQARRIVDDFPNLFTLDFETNKMLLDEKYEIYSKQMRNKIAGYIITVIKTKDNNYESIRLKNKEVQKSRRKNKRKK